jgi:hypothetical protein
MRRKERREDPRDGKRGDDGMAVTCMLSFVGQELKILYRILAARMKIAGVGWEKLCRCFSER